MYILYSLSLLTILGVDPSKTTADDLLKSIEQNSIEETAKTITKVTGKNFGAASPGRKPSNFTKFSTAEPSMAQSCAAVTDRKLGLGPLARAKKKGVTVESLMEQGNAAFEKHCGANRAAQSSSQSSTHPSEVVANKSRLQREWKHSSSTIVGKDYSPLIGWDEVRGFPKFSLLVCAINGYLAVSGFKDFALGNINLLIGDHLIIRHWKWDAKNHQVLVWADYTQPSSRNVPGIDELGKYVHGFLKW